MGSVDPEKEFEATASLWERNYVGNMNFGANDSRLPRAGTHSLSTFNCMSDKFLLYIAHTFELRVGVIWPLKSIFLNSSENAKIVNFGIRVTHTKEVHKGGLVLCPSSWAKGRGETSYQ